MSTVDDALSTRIRVVVRIRPLLAKEKAAGHGVTSLECHKAKREVVVKETLDDSVKRRVFRFDRVFDSSIGQEQFFSDAGIEDMVKKSLLGQNISVIAYGQTGVCFAPGVRGVHFESDNLLACGDASRIWKDSYHGRSQ